MMEPGFSEIIERRSDFVRKPAPIRMIHFFCPNCRRLPMEDSDRFKCA